MSRIVVVLSCALACACGGAIVNPLEDGGTDGGPTSDAPSPYCPSTAPGQGGSCSHDGVSCEYGSDPNINCNIVAICVGGSWNVSSMSNGECPTPPNPSDCPATFASVPVGQHCGNLVGTTCSYQQGFCGCSVGSGGPYPADAAAVATWVCDAPEAGCPLPRPRLGTSCTQDALQCDYSSCELPTGASLVCKDGAWEDQPYGCAL
jgi:hypothetical protein